MRNELRRIEAMLAQLAQPQQTGTEALPPPIAQPVSATPTLRSPSFETLLSSAPLPYQADAPAAIAVAARSAVMVSVQSNSRSSGLSELKMPTLPKLKTSDHQPAKSAPAVAAPVVETLNAIEGMAQGWQEELQQRLRQIQDIYAEGPIVDGWLEAYTVDSHEAQITAEAKTRTTPSNSYDRSLAQSDRDSGALPATASNRAAGCRLCGLHDDGQLWFRHCPAEQMAAVSLAIARYERLKQLLTRKQHLETQLGKLAEALSTVYTHLADPGAGTAPIVT